jgi:ABC-2 type transport system permease protein
MKKMLTVLRWEFARTAANKAFVVMTILGPFLILALTVLPSLVVSKQGLEPGSRLAIAGASQEELGRLGAAFGQVGLSVVAAATGDSPALSEDKAKVLAGTLSGLLVFEEGWTGGGAFRLYTKNGSEALLFGIVEKVVGAELRESRMRASGLDPALLAPILAPATMEVVKLAGGGETGAGQDRFLSLMFTVLSFVMMLYMTTLMYGQMIGRSVVLEKTSKTVEIMLSSVSPRELLFGKVLGLGTAALVQYGVWAGAGLLITLVFGPMLGIALPPSLTAANLGWLVLFFLLAFFLYATAYAALGAAAEDEQQLGQLSWPLLVFLIVPMVFIATFLMNPDSALARFFSLFPLTSPIVMFIRVIASSPPAWEIVLSVLIALASIWGIAILSARVFRIGILMTGKRGSFGEMWRWIREG